MVPQMARTVRNMILRLAVPSDGALHQPTLDFLRACGLGVRRPNLRRYTAEVPALPGVVVHFQRAADIGLKVEEGSADMGVVGRDRFLETRRENGSTRVVIDSLGFGNSELLIGVPEGWIDVTSVTDLVEISMEFREKGQDLRVATKYPRLVESFLLSRGVKFFSLVESSGTLEAAPAMGYADIIADISETGVTLRENRLKTIDGGSVISSEACLIGNSTLVSSNTPAMRLATALVERIEAYLEALGFYSVTANMQGDNPDFIARQVLEHGDISGLRGPTISKVYTKERDDWFAVTVIVGKERLLDVVEIFRQIGGTHRHDRHGSLLNVLATTGGHRPHRNQETQYQRHHPLL